MMCSLSVTSSCVERHRFLLLCFGPPGSFFPQNAKSCPERSCKWGEEEEGFLDQPRGCY